MGLCCRNFGGARRFKSGIDIFSQIISSGYGLVEYNRRVRCCHKYFNQMIRWLHNPGLDTGRRLTVQYMYCYIIKLLGRQLNCLWMDTHGLSVETWPATCKWLWDVGSELVKWESGRSEPTLTEGMSLTHLIHCWNFLSWYSMGGRSHFSLGMSGEIGADKGTLNWN